MGFSVGMEPPESSTSDATRPGMRLPASPNDATRVGVRSTVMESIRGCGCGLGGAQIDKEELRKRLVMPKYLRIAMRNSIRFQDPNSGLEKDQLSTAESSEDAEPPQTPESPMVVFINSKSGGRHGPELKLRLQQLIAEEQVRILAMNRQCKCCHVFLQICFPCSLPSLA